MKTLYLLRHAKSSWDDASLKDFDRPLNNRGQKTAPKMGAFMRKQKIKPDIVISSPAVRASQTTELVREAAGLTAPLHFEAEIYEATPQRLLTIVQGIDDQMKSAMLVGHNPGFEELLAALTGESKRMPTAALACIELDVPRWSEVASGSGKLSWLTRPKDLE